jgi:FkbM family methyltransferase
MIMSLTMANRPWTPLVSDRKKLNIRVSPNDGSVNLPRFADFIQQNADKVDALTDILLKGTDDLSHDIVRRILYMHRIGSAIREEQKKFGITPNNAEFAISVPYVCPPAEQREVNRQWEWRNTHVPKIKGVRFKDMQLPSFGIPLYYASKRSLAFLEERCVNLKGKDVLDCGAFTGDSALTYSEYHPRTIHAFEPDAGTFEKLKQTVGWNHREDVIVPVNLATGDAEGTIDFFGGCGGSSSTISINGANHYTVRCTTIDNYVRANKLNVGLIKMDIEGAEYSAIMGGIETIKSQKPILIISIYHTPKDFFEIKPYLESLDIGYEFMIRQLSCFYGDGGAGEIELIAYISPGN